MRFRTVLGSLVEHVLEEVQDTVEEADQPAKEPGVDLAAVTAYAAAARAAAVVRISRPAVIRRQARGLARARRHRAVPVKALDHVRTVRALRLPHPVGRDKIVLYICKKCSTAVKNVSAFSIYSATSSFSAMNKSS